MDGRFRLHLPRVRAPPVLPDGLQEGAYSIHPTIHFLAKDANQNCSEFSSGRSALEPSIEQKYH